MSEARAILKVAAHATTARTPDEMLADLRQARYLMDRALVHLMKAAECETHRTQNSVAADCVREARKRLNHAHVLALEVQK